MSNTIELNGVRYRPVEEPKEPFVIVRTYSAGVFAGNLTSRNGKEGKMENAIRIWSWAGAATLSQMAMEGVKRPEECKFGMPVTVTLTEIIEVIETTPEAEKNLKEVPEGKE